MAKTVSEQIKTAQVNTFTGGLNTDLHPLLQPNDTLSDCVNGTLITYNGNENMLQNDMGNYALKGAQLPDGYIPLGMKEYQGVVYMVLLNPETHKVQIGSYPSPQPIWDPKKVEDFEIFPYEFAEVSNEELLDTIIAAVNSSSSEYSEYKESCLDTSGHRLLLSKSLDEASQLNVYDKYQLQIETIPENLLWQEFNLFVMDINGNECPLDISVANNSEIKNVS